MFELILLSWLSLKSLMGVELDKPFCQTLKKALDDKKGMVSMIDVEYTWMRTKCNVINVDNLDHKSIKMSSETC